MRKGVLLASFAPIVLASTACARSFPTVELPRSASNVISELRRSFVIVAYQDGPQAVVQAAALQEKGSWTKAFPGETLNSIEADESGATVVVRFLTAVEFNIRNVVLRDGFEVFRWEGAALVVSPDGRFFYGLIAGGGGPIGRLLDDDGKVFALPRELDKHPANYNFVGRDSLLVATRNLESIDRGQATLGELALVRLPSEVIWRRPIPAGEFHVRTGQEMAIAVGGGLFVIGECGNPNRKHKVYCLNRRGETIWASTVENSIQGIGLLGSYVVILHFSSVAVLDLSTGSQTFAWALALTQGKSVLGVRKVVSVENGVFNAWILASGKPTPLPISLRAEPESEPAVLISTEYSTIWLVGDRLLGVRTSDSSGTIMLGVPQR